MPQIPDCREGDELQELPGVAPLSACSSEGSFPIFWVESGASVNGFLSSASESPYILLLKFSESYFGRTNKSLVGWDACFPGGRPAVALPSCLKGVTGRADSCLHRSDSTLKKAAIFSFDTRTGLHVPGRCDRVCLTVKVRRSARLFG